MHSKSELELNAGGDAGGSNERLEEGLDKLQANTSANRHQKPGRVLLSEILNPLNRF